MINNQTQQIVSAFEQQGILPEAIAEAEGIPVSAVKAVLMQFSTQYRQLCKAEPKDETNFNFTDAERREAKQVIVRIMRTTDDENLQAKMACHIDNEENRNRASRGMLGAGSININQFALILQKANAALEATETKRAVVNPTPTLPKPQSAAPVKDKEAALNRKLQEALIEV